MAASRIPGAKGFLLACLGALSLLGYLWKDEGASKKNTQGDFFCSFFKTLHKMPPRLNFPTMWFMPGLGKVINAVLFTFFLSFVSLTRPGELLWGPGLGGLPTFLSQTNVSYQRSRWSWRMPGMFFCASALYGTGCILS